MFEEYEFDREIVPKEEDVRDGLNFGLVFYARIKNTLRLFCPTLRQEFSIEMKSKASIKEINCPNERNCSRCDCEFINCAYEHGKLTRYRDVAIFQRTNRGMVLRVFRYNFDFSDERYTLFRDGTAMPEETFRVFYNADRSVEIYSRYCLSYNPVSGTKVVISNWRFKKIFQEYVAFDIMTDYKDLDGTLFEGYKKYINIWKDYMHDEYDNDGSLIAKLLIGLFKFPMLKELMKHNFDELVLEYLHSICGGYKLGHILNLKAKNFKEAIKLDISKLDKLDIEDDIMTMTKETLKTVQKMVKHKIPITRENLAICDNDRFGEIVNYVEDMVSAVKYLRSQKNSSASDFADYLKECNILNLNLNDKEIKYPKNLISAHNRTSALAKYEKDEIMNESFSQMTQKYESWRFRQKNMSLVIIKTVGELKNWAVKFHNCSAGYADKIASGATLIFIVRDLHKRKKPYCMLEYSLNRKEIVQARGDKNIQASDEIKEFLDKWLKFIKTKKVAV